MPMQAALKVDPDVVLSKSSEMKSIRNSLSSTMQQAEDKIHSLSNAWVSEAANAYQTQFNKIHKDVEEMLNIVDEYSRNLDEIAQNYKAADNRVQQAASALPSDVIV